MHKEKGMKKAGCWTVGRMGETTDEWAKWKEARTQIWRIWKWKENKAKKKRASGERMWRVAGRREEDIKGNQVTQR